MINFSGQNRLKLRLNKLNKVSLVKAYDKTMSDSIAKIISTSMKNTPHKTGNLKSSYNSLQTPATTAGCKGKIWNYAEYAVFVHEETWTKLHHGGIHKFLEYALNIEKAFIKRVFSYNVTKALRNCGK